MPIRLADLGVGQDFGGLFIGQNGGSYYAARIGMLLAGFRGQKRLKIRCARGHDTEDPVANRAKRSGWITKGNHFASIIKALAVSLRPADRCLIPVCALATK